MKVIKDLTGKTATKTDAEWEDASSEKLVRPSPKKKPPRKDLRNRKVEVEDPDNGPDANRVAMVVSVSHRFLTLHPRFTKVAIDFDTKEQLETYLKDHPDADKSMHTVKPKKDKDPPEKGGDKEPVGDKTEEPSTEKRDPSKGPESKEPKGDDENKPKADKSKSKGKKRVFDRPDKKPESKVVEFNQRLKTTLGAEKAEELESLVDELSFGDQDLGEAIRTEASKRYTDLVGKREDVGALLSELGGEDENGDPTPFDEESSSKSLSVLSKGVQDFQRKVTSIQDALEKAEDTVKVLNNPTKSGVEKAKADLKKAEGGLFTVKANKALGDLKKKPTAKFTQEQQAAHEAALTEAAKAVTEATEKDKKAVEEAQSNLDLATSSFKSTDDERKKKLSKAQEGLAKAQKDAEGLSKLQTGLNNSRAKLVEAAADHQAAVAVLHSFANPTNDLPVEVDTSEHGLQNYREDSLRKYEALPKNLQKARMNAARKAIKDIDKDLENPDNTESQKVSLKASRAFFKADYDAGKLHQTIDSGKGEKGGKGGNLAGSLIEFARSKNPDSPHLFDLSEGVKGKNFRKGVHNVLVDLADDDFVRAIESHVPERSKHMLEALKRGTYEDVEGGGEQEALTKEMAAYLRKSILNAVMNEAGAEGDEEDEGFGPKNKSLSKTKRLDDWWKSLFKRWSHSSKSVLDKGQNTPTTKKPSR